MNATKHAFYAPDKILLDLGIEAPEEIDIEVIAHYCGATVVYEPLTGCEAYILGHGDRAIITINSSSNRGRQRFSIGHELGHWARDRGTIGLACDKRKMLPQRRFDDREHKANVYATDLLLPASLFVPRARGKEMTFNTVRPLADLFQMSLTSTAIRLVKLGSFPAILVYTEHDGCKWSVKSDDLFFRVHDAPGKDSVANDLLKGRTVSAGPTDVPADEWIGGRRAGRYTVREHSIKVGDGVLTLLWWKDERIFTDR